MTTSAGLSFEAFEKAMVCEMQPKWSEMRLRCGGRGCRRWGGGCGCGSNWGQKMDGEGAYTIEKKKRKSKEGTIEEASE